MRTRRWAVVFFTALACAIAQASQDKAPFPPKQTESLDLIVPGVRIGSIKLGMPVTDAIEMLGTPKRALGYFGVMSYRYEALTIEADSSVPIGKQVVRSIDTTSLQFRTSKRLSVGSEERLIRDVMGTPTCGTSHGKTIALAYSTGISFIVSTDTRQVAEIAVRSTFC